ncbi:MAG: thioredoxin family protein [Erysipelotrichales bacterium]
MKKLTKFLGIFFMVLFVVGCGAQDKKPSDVAEAVKNKESFIVVASASDCAACKVYMPIVDEYSKENKDTKVLNVVIDELKEDQEKTDFIAKYNVSATPTTIFFNKGEVKTIKTGTLSKDELVDFTKDYLK